MRKSPKHILFLFIDGLGIGANNPDINPLAHSWPSLESLNGGEAWTNQSKNLKAIDANLSLDGLPQSGTGQASLFTGTNCAKLAGRHFGPYPHSKTKNTIASKNIFQRLIDLGAGTDELAFANAYPDRFFSFVEKTNRWTVTTLACQSAGVRLRRKKDVLNGTALTSDLTGKGWANIGHELPYLSPKEAGRRLMNLAQEHRFTLFEYYHSDKAGHSLDMDRAIHIMGQIDEFIGGILKEMDLDEDLLVITSDHGNIEDMSIKTHTRNPVPLVVFPAIEHTGLVVESIVDVVDLVQYVLASPS